MMKRFYVLFATLLSLTICVLPVTYAQEDAQDDDFVPVCDRTSQVRTAILRALPDIDDCADVTAEDLASITHLQLGFRWITALKADDFSGLTALEWLNLPYNSLSSLPAGLFDELTALEYLSLWRNDLSSFPDGIFDNLTQLETLNLDDNNLSRLPAGIFDELTALTWIEIPDNKLSSLPDDIFDNLTQLEYLTLDGNLLSSFPDGIFDNLTQLEHLGLHNNALESLPDGIFDDLTALTWLELYNTGLSSLPDGIFDKLTNLGHLGLAGNDLSRFPDGIFDELSALTYLTLHKNDLSSLPDGIFAGLTSLKYLYLSQNELSRLPDGIFAGLTSLDTLNLSGNAVDPLPVTVSLKQVGEGQFKATAHTGAPYHIGIRVSITNGGIDGSRTIQISKGKLESGTVTVTRTPGTVDAVTVDIGRVPRLPGSSRLSHWGYEFVKSEDLPLTVIERPGPAAPGIASEVVLPGETTLSANYPNPFNPETWIPYQLANPSDVVISIYDGRGQVIRRLALGHQPAGYYTNRSRAAYWDGRNDFGERVSSGLYFYQLQTDTVSLLHKMVILK